MKVKIPKNNKTLCLLANTKVGDLYGHKIMNMIKNNFKITDIDIVGNGGEYLKKHGQSSIVNLDDFREKFLYLWRYSVKSIQSNKHSAVNMYQIGLRMNNNILNLMDEKNVISNITRIRPSCIVNLDNEMLSEGMAYRFNGNFFT
jgi:hypothetical protein